MSSNNSRNLTPSGVCSPMQPNSYAAHTRPSQRQFDCVEDEGPKKSISLCFRWDNNVAVPKNTPYLLTLDNGSKIEGTLDSEGRLSTLASCHTLKAQLHPNFSPLEIQKARNELKLQLDEILAKEQIAADKLKKAQEQQGTLESIYYKGVAFTKGFGQGALDTLKLIHILGPGTRGVNISKAIANSKSTENQIRFESFLVNLTQEERNSLSELLGFDPLNIKPEDLTDAFELTLFILDDEPSKAILANFAINYIEIQNNETLIHIAGTLAFEIILTALISLLTLGAGGVAKGAGALIRSLIPIGNI